MAEGAKYIKIAKKDKNGVDQSNTLTSLKKITIPYSTGNITYKILARNEEPKFFLYEIDYAGVEWLDRADIKYVFTGSTTTGNLEQAGNFGQIPISNSLNDSLSFYNSSQFAYQVKTYPQKTVHVEFSGSVFVSKFGPAGVGNKKAVIGIALGKLNGSPSTILNLTNTTVEGANTLDSFHLTASIPISSFNGRLGEYLFPYYDLNNPTPIPNNISFPNSVFLFITSSDATGPSFETIPEPYLGGNDFSRALDCQPLLNNVDRNRRHNLYQDIDYSAGLNEPTNFDLLISGSALKAEVQLSNYTTRRHVIPRYEGSKSTSQKLNTWSKGDKGTYGKTPTVESLKRIVAYSDNTSGGIAGWPPERMNASAIFVRYLIDEDGDIKIPNTSINSLEDVQGTFQTGERVLINSGKPGSGEATAYRKIIRGGARIEPILYTQIGKQPGSEWTTSINLQDIQTTSGSATSNYQNNGSIGIKPNYQIRDRFLFNSGPTNNNLIGSATYSITSNPYNFYQTPVGVVNEAVTLNINIPFLRISFKSTSENLNSSLHSDTAQNTTGILGIILKIETNGNDSTYASSQRILGEGIFNTNVYNANGQAINFGPMNPNIFFQEPFTFSIPPGVLQEDSKISFEYNFDTTANVDNLKLKILQGAYQITQTPVPTLPIITGDNAIWGYYNQSTHPSVITSSNAVSSSLAGLYGDPNVSQKDIINSGFNPIALPWSIKIGDEFRFEGDERFTYMVGKVYSPNESGGGRLSQTGSIEVHFDNNLPISASIDNFNLDHFLIRRYVDDASQIIIEGFKPLNSGGPHIIKPEFSVSKLNKGIDEYITILTEKNLLS